MLKNLLVNIPTERSPRPVIDGAISLAARLCAQLDAVSVGHEIPNMPFLAEGGAAVATMQRSSVPTSRYVSMMSMIWIAWS